MRQVKKNAYVNFSAEQMFFLVDDIKSYPEFLPWCTKTIIHERTESSVRATIKLSKSGVSSKFTTCNTMISSQKIDLLLEEGPFSYFKGTWLFESVSDEETKLRFQMSYTINNPITDLLFSKNIDVVSQRIIEAFKNKIEG